MTLVMTGAAPAPLSAIDDLRIDHAFQAAHHAAETVEVEVFDAITRLVVVRVAEVGRVGDEQQKFVAL